MKNICHESMADMSSVERAGVLTAVLLKIPEDFILLECYAALLGEQQRTTSPATWHNIPKDYNLHFQC